MKVNRNKWRLPTKEEFEKVLYPNMDKIPNFEKHSYYWSSSEYGSSNAWFFSFTNGLAYGNDKYVAKQVLAVRDVSSDSTNSSNSTIIGNLEIYNLDLGSMSWYEAIALESGLYSDEDMDDSEAVDKLNDNIKI
jgi:hypothetical protein